MPTEVTFFPLGSWKRRKHTSPPHTRHWHGVAPRLLDASAASIGAVHIGAFEYGGGVWELRVFTPSGGPDFVVYPPDGGSYHGLVLRRLMED